MIIRCSCRSSFRSLLPFHSQNSRHIFRLPRSVRGKRRGKPLIYIAPYVLGAQPFKSFKPGTPQAGLLPSGFVRPLFGLVRLRLEYWQGSRRRPRVCGCGWWSAGPPCGGLAGRGAYLARRGRFRGRWRRLVVAAGVVPWPRPLVRAGGPFAGLVAWWLVLVCPCPLRGPCGPRFAGAGVVLTGGAWSLPPLRFGPLQWPPLRSLVLQSSAPAALVLVRAAGGVALVAWSDCQRTGAAGGAGVVAVFVVAVAGVEPAPLVAVLQWSRPWPLRAVVVSLRGWRCSP